MNLAFDLDNSSAAKAEDVLCVVLKNPILTAQEKILHGKAIKRSMNFKKAHAELLEVIMEVDKSKKDLKIKESNNQEASHVIEKQKSVKAIVANPLPAARRDAEQPKIEKVAPIKFERIKVCSEVVRLMDLRDKRRCQERMPNGEICGSTRWLDYHHIIEVQHGGANTLENLITLCGFHHRLRHRPRR